MSARVFYNRSDEILHIEKLKIILNTRSVSLVTLSGGNYEISVQNLKMN